MPLADRLRLPLFALAVALVWALVALVALVVALILDLLAIGVRAFPILLGTGKKSKTRPMPKRFTNR